MTPPGAWSTAEGAASWQASLAQRQQSLAFVTELLFAQAGIGPGVRALEVGSGTGDAALLAAARVGPAGSVLATDASAPMLEVAARLVRCGDLAQLPHVRPRLAPRPARRAHRAASGRTLRRVCVGTAGAQPLPRSAHRRCPQASRDPIASARGRAGVLAVQPSGARGRAARRRVRAHPAAIGARPARVSLLR